MKSLWLCLFLMICSSGFCQTGKRVLVRNNPSSTVNAPLVDIKFYNEQFTYEHGCTIYRRKREDFEWMRITNRNLLPSSDTSGLLPEEQFLLTSLFTDNFKFPEEGLLQVSYLLRTFMNNTFAQRLGILFQDSTCVFGETYQYKVSCEHDRKVIDIGTSKDLKVAEYRKAPAVTSFEVRQKGTKLYFNWQVDEALFFAYNLFVSIEDSLEMYPLNSKPILLTLQKNELGVKEYPEPKFTFSRIRSEKVYTFYIAGVDYFGVDGQLTASQTLKTKDFTPPPAPSGFTIQKDSMKLSFRWDRSDSPDVTGYEVLYKTHSDSVFISLSDQLIRDTSYYSSFTDPGTYYFCVASVDSAGNTTPGKTLFTEIQDLIPPPPPTGLMAESDTGKVTLRWQNPRSEDLMGFYVFRTVDSSNLSHFYLLNSDPYPDSVFTDWLDKFNSDRFFYYLVAVDSNYNRSKRSEIISTRLPDILPPSPPRITDARFDGDELEIFWKSSNDNDILGYRLFITIDSTKEMALHKGLIGPDKNSFSRELESGDKKIQIRIEVLDSARNSSPSQEPFTLSNSKHTVETLSQFTATMKIRKRKKLIEFEWQNPWNEKYMGAVIFSGSKVENLLPVTGLIQDTHFKTQLDHVVFQIILYNRQGQRMVSQILRPEK